MITIYLISLMLCMLNLAQRIFKNNNNKSIFKDIDLALIPVLNSFMAIIVIFETFNFYINERNFRTV